VTWTFTDAGPGFVVLSGELPDTSGELAVAFADDADTAQTLADASLNVGITAARDTLAQSWHDWAATTQLPPAQPGDPTNLTDALRRSATVPRVHEDRSYPGAIVAGLTIPWGDTTNNPAWVPLGLAPGRRGNRVRPARAGPHRRRAVADVPRRAATERRPLDAELLPRRHPRSAKAHNSTKPRCRSCWPPRSVTWATPSTRE